MFETTLCLTSDDANKQVNWKIIDVQKSDFYLQKLEKYCIQDLMYHAVHASRVGVRSLASILRQVIKYSHAVAIFV